MTEALTETGLVIIRRADDRSKHKPTPTQLRVLELYSHGIAREEIATRLDMSVNTVRTHTQQAAVRMGTHSIAHAVSTCLRKGWIV